MTFARYLARNISLLNVMLATVVVAILIYALLPLSSSSVAYKPRSGKAKQESAPTETQEARVPTPSEYTVVVENNLFHPDRRIPPEKKEEKELPKPELTLYGTLIAGDLSIAYVDDRKAPYTTPGRGKRPRVLKKGDVIGGFVLKQIEANRIVLVRNEEVMTVNLDTAKVREDVGRAQATAPTASRGQTPAVATQPVVPQRAVAAPPGGGPAAATPPLPAPPPQRQIRMQPRPQN